jgi:hypothetical protein
VVVPKVIAEVTDAEMVIVVTTSSCIISSEPLIFTHVQFSGRERHL